MIGSKQRTIAVSHKLVLANLKLLKHFLLTFHLFEQKKKRKNKCVTQFLSEKL